VLHVTELAVVSVRGEARPTATGLLLGAARHHAHASESGQRRPARFH